METLYISNAIEAHLLTYVCTCADGRKFIVKAYDDRDASIKGRAETHKDWTEETDNKDRSFSFRLESPEDEPTSSDSSEEKE